MGEECDFDGLATWFNSLLASVLFFLAIICFVPGIFFSLFSMFYFFENKPVTNILLGFGQNQVYLIHLDQNRVYTKTKYKERTTSGFWSMKIVLHPPGKHWACGLQRLNYYIFFRAVVVIFVVVVVVPHCTYNRYHKLQFDLRRVSQVFVWSASAGAPLVIILAPPPPWPSLKLLEYPSGTACSERKYFTVYHRGSRFLYRWVPRWPVTIQ